MVKRDLCTGCGACAAVCGAAAIVMRRDREGFTYPVMNMERCTRCGLCDRVCPISERSKRDTGPAHTERQYFGARAREDAMRSLGSSGGMFPLLAAQVLKDGGTVFGATLHKDGHVCHIGITAREDIGEISRTKYVQSDLSSVWEEIGSLLKQGRKVLFCGTPCQCDAVRRYAGERRDSLILVDLICYGVPSPGIWERYVQFLEKKYRGAFQAFYFRDKRAGDHGHTTVLRIGGQERIRPLLQDLFCKSYFYNVNLRPSCFSCRYCTAERDSDITLGDFWGIEQVRPDLDDGMGISAVICHTEAGNQLWEQVRGRTEWFSCQRQELVNERQPRLRMPKVPSKRRALMMRLYGCLPFPVWIRLFRLK